MKQRQTLTKYMEENGRLKENVKENVKRTKDIKAELKQTKQNKHCPLQDNLHIMSHSL